MKRRAFLQSLAAAGAGIAWAPARVHAAKQPLNILFILADDLGWAELGCYGNTFNETPNLDRLARQGMRFTQAYAAAPVCSPFRASLMTGQYPARVGITDYLRPDADKHLPEGLTTLAEALDSAGYATGITGKWHLSGYAKRGAAESPPARHGFDETIISSNDGIGGGSYYHPYHWNTEIEKRLEGEEYLVDRHNLEALDFVERHREEPFFLYKSHYAVHTRMVGKPELVRHFGAKPGAGKGNNARRNNPHLAAQLKVIDEGVGMLLERLDRLGLAQNTLVIFTSDNGGEDRVTVNGPLRAGKSTLYEGGIREPLIMRWPGVIEPGATCETPVTTPDFLPTLLEAAGAPLPGQPLDGVSLRPLFEGGRIDRDTLYWHYPLEKPHFLGGRSSGAVRAGDWKLIEFFDTAGAELYNLADDPGEKHDLFAEKPEKAAELHRKLAAWRKETGAVIPEGQRAPEL